MDKKQSDTMLLVHLIKSESEQTRKELRKEMAAIKSESEKTRKDLAQKLDNVKSQLEFKVASLESKLDDKFEDHRRKTFNDFQSFQDDILTEIKELRQEMAVNSHHRKLISDLDTRLTKAKRRLLAN